MSANNFLLIRKNQERFIIEECNADTMEPDFLVKECNSLEDAIKEANQYMTETEVEYGLQINI